ncbi:response regulator [Bosea sp. (in: a-proteobacteria)]|uniref:response regulator n=1 Tax=Bosea sp. (in: a-proteobacteria) TaxID=1871050 RepID=UPI00261F8C8E|nr:response regulator [Bosea sp. (in: a-proteobacteria)]MCO5090325.1 response regulator [Bosea sp. (in: a-proteobacteria)]
MVDIRVLIVEDDPFIAMDIETAVADELGDGVELIVVESVAEARRMTGQRLDCALLDINVVDGETFEVARVLQDTGTPFAFVSGSAPHDVPAPLRGARFLRKPFSTREVAAFVTSAVGLAAPKAAPG